MLRARHGNKQKRLTTLVYCVRIWAMRLWRNWQTRKIQVLVSSTFMWVQVPSTAPNSVLLGLSFLFVLGLATKPIVLSAIVDCNPHRADARRHFLAITRASTLQVPSTAPTKNAHRKVRIFLLAFTLTY